MNEPEPQTDSTNVLGLTLSQLETLQPEPDDDVTDGSHDCDVTDGCRSPLAKLEIKVKKATQLRGPPDVRLWVFS